MISFVRKSFSCLILKHNSSPVSRSPFSPPISLHFFSTSTEIQLGFNPELFDILRNKYKFSPELASRVTSELTRLKNSKNAESVLSFFKESGFSNAQLQKFARYHPPSLALSLDDYIMPKFKFFQEQGFTSDDISRLISCNPRVLALSLNDKIIPSMSLLKSLLGSNNEIAKVVTRSPRFLGVSFRKNVLPNIEFFKSCGIPMRCIHILLTSHASCFMAKPEDLRKWVDKTNEMGIDTSSRNFMYAIATLASLSNESWENKLQAFHDLGFSVSDISTMFKKFPRTFLFSAEKVKKIKELLIATGKFNLSCIVNYPCSVGFSIEKRYKPRLRILEILESKNLLTEWPCLGTFCRKSDDEFYEIYISPYLNEVSDVDIPKIFSRSKRIATLSVSLKS